MNSYHREYLWSQDSSRGFCDAMLKYGYFDNKEQIEEYTRNDRIETSKAVMQQIWMDAKRKTSKPELIRTTNEIVQIIRAFKADILFLGDDEAGNYIGNQFLDTKLPVVFWGFSGNPVKYGLVDTANRPGHNITGVYQSGYYLESLQLIKSVMPAVKTFAVLSDDSPSGRAHQKGIKFLALRGELPLKLVESVVTNDLQLWKKRALELQKNVDAFFVVQYSTLKDDKGNAVPDREVARWYLENITIPEAALGPFVKQGLLCAADDSGYRQGFEAVTLARDILTKGASPATYPTHAPKRGPLTVNTARARQLGITLTDRMGIEHYFDGVTP